MSIAQAPYSSRLSLYLKVANILRNRIVKGVWHSGARLPNISALCEEFQVGRITIRQALHLLSEEGLINSSRGRGTFVAEDTAKKLERDKYSDLLNDAHNNIRLLSVGEAGPLPYSLQGEEGVFQSYRCIRKLRSYKDTPYCLMDIYVESNLFSEFPPEELTKTPIATLVSDYSNQPVASARQTLCIGFADYETSQILDCSMAAPVAEVDRYFMDLDNRVISRGHYLYRGDLFVMETEHKGDPLTDLPSGWMPEVKTE